jgi:phosphopantothenoylcysteine decarboxylase/phosphopantothenate--cysteine ligase
MIAANRVGKAGSGFEGEENELLLLTSEGEENLGKGSKRHLAGLLIKAVAVRLQGYEGIETDSDQGNRPASGN